MPDHYVLDLRSATPADSVAMRSKIARSASTSLPATLAMRPPPRTAFDAPEYDFNTEPTSMTPKIVEEKREDHRRLDQHSAPLTEATPSPNPPE